MKKFDLQFIENVAKTKYSDMRGYIEVDSLDPKDLSDLCAEKGIDMSANFLYAFEISDENPRGIDQHKSIICKVYLIDKSTYGGNYEAIAKNDSVILRQKSFNATYKEIANCIKRLSIAMVSPISYAIKNVSLEE